MSLPGGTVTFLFTDIEGSTVRWERDPTAMSSALRRHDAITSASVAEAGGEVFKTTGDGACAVFGDVESAARAALAINQALEIEDWPGDIAPIRVRAAIHTGPAEVRDGDYFGPTLNRVARLMAAGNGGQVLLSGSARSLLPDGAADLVDLGEHRLRDLLRPEHIFSLAGADRALAPLRVLDARFHNLPIQVTPFLGREGDLARLHELVSEHRLVTLTGPGGTGKTRLGLEVAADLVDRFDGVFFVGLAPVRDPEDVGPAIAAAMGMAIRTGDDVLRRLQDRLAAGRHLLLLDNFEHVMAAASLVGSLLDRVSDVHILVTSRELLRLRAERHYPVAPMEIPQVQGADPDVIASYEAVGLFVERATAVAPSFRLDDGNVEDVVAICRRLDGLPLAIELAAARVKLFPPARLLKALEAGIGVLNRGPVDAPERHRALLDTVRWSYELLDDLEKVVFRRLGAFSGGLSLEALERVCLAGLGAAGLDVAEALSDKSLIRVTEGSGGEIRLEMLETIHGFAREQLAADADAGSIRLAHAEFYAAMAEEAEPRLRGHEQARWMARLDDEAANLDVALSWAFEGGDVVVGQRTVAALRDYWFYQGKYRDLARWTERAMADLPQDDVPLRAGVLLAHGFNLYSAYDPRAIDTLDEAARLFQSAGKPRLHALSVIWAGGAREILADDLSSAGEIITHGLALAREVGEAHLEGQALNMLGEMERTAGNYEQARRIQIEGLEVARRSGEMRRVAMLLHNLALIAHHLDDDDEANRLLVDSLDLSIEQSFDMQVAHSFLGLAEQIALRGDPRTGARLIGAADGHFERFGFLPQPADAPDYERIRAYVQDVLGGEEYGREVAKGRLLSLGEATALAREA